MSELNAKKLHCPNCKSYDISAIDNDFWVCDDCKTKFRSIQEFEEEISNKKSHCKVFWILGGVALFFSFLLFYLVWDPKDPEYAFIAAAALLVPAVIYILCGFSNKRDIEKMKKELEYLKENCFN